MRRVTTCCNGGYPEQTDALHKRISEECGPHYRCLNDVQRFIAERTNMPFVSLAAVEAWADANSAAQKAQQLALSITDACAYPTQNEFAEWELIAHRCERAFVWAEQIGLCDEDWTKARIQYLDPIRSQLLAFQETMTSFGDEWRKARGTLLTGFFEIWEGEAHEDYEAQQAMLKQQDDCEDDECFFRDMVKRRRP